MLPLSSADHQRLEEAEYEPRLSFGRRVIWERPDTGLYYSEEAAPHLLDTKHIRNKSGATAGR